MRVQQRVRVASLAGLFVAVVAAYSNHFGNGFHFDDGHTILENPAIRTLENVPRFFIDARTFSQLPAGQTYRPLVTASLALDYWLGSGLNHPFWFHLSTFFWYIVQLVLMYRLYLYVLEKSCPGLENFWVAWFAVALYGLHPASAETINYIIQRSDLYVALGIVAGLVLYAWKPTWRRFGLYLIPPMCAMLSKPTALIFAPLLFAYIFLIDRVRAGPLKPGGAETVESLQSCAIRSAPAFVLCLAFTYLERSMTPATFFQPSIDAFDYFITQPYVTLRYFRSFFLPLYLNVDSDLQAFHSVANLRVLIGFVFVAFLIYAALITARTKKWRPVSFGLWWFVISLIPTAIYPLNDVENDHRMFLPFVGLSLAVVSSTAILLRRCGSGAIRAGAACGLAVLVAFAYGTHSRNATWHTDESLWRDDVEKSPNNPRGHDWLGAALNRIPGRQPDAIQEFQTALRIKPDDANAHLNLGKIFAEAPDRSGDAMLELEKSVRSEPSVAEAHWKLAEVLSRVPDRLPDAIREFEIAARLDPDSFEAHFGLGFALSHFPDRVPEAIAEFQSALRIKPEDVTARRDLGLALARVPGRLPEAIQELETVVRMTPDSAEAHTDLGSMLSLIPDRLPDAIREYEAALRIRPDYFAAHIDLAAAFLKIPGRLPQALAEFEAAYQIKPDPALRRAIDSARVNVKRVN